MRLPGYYILAVGGVVLAGSSGYLASEAMSSGKQTSARTVTISVSNGAQGPPGPPGPAGLVCPTGYSEGYVVINHPGGQETLFTCLKNATTK